MLIVTQSWKIQVINIYKFTIKKNKMFFDNVCFMSTIYIWETRILKSFAFIAISFFKIYNIRFKAKRKTNLEFLKSNQRNILLLLSSIVFVVYIDTIKTISILIFINLLNMDAKITVNSFSLFFVNLLIKKLIRNKQLNRKESFFIELIKTTTTVYITTYSTRS